MKYEEKFKKLPRKYYENKKNDQFTKYYWNFEKSCHFWENLM